MFCALDSVNSYQLTVIRSVPSLSQNSWIYESSYEEVAEWLSSRVAKCASESCFAFGLACASSLRASLVTFFGLACASSLCASLVTPSLSSDSLAHRRFAPLRQAQHIALRPLSFDFSPRPLRFEKNRLRIVALRSPRYPVTFFSFKGKSPKLFYDKQKTLLLSIIQIYYDNNSFFTAGRLRFNCQIRR